MVVSDFQVCFVLVRLMASFLPKLTMDHRDWSLTGIATRIKWLLLDFQVAGLNFLACCSAAVVEDQIWGLTGPSLHTEIQQMWKVGDQKHRCLQLQLEGEILESSQILEGHFSVCQLSWGGVRSPVTAGGESQHLVIASFPLGKGGGMICLWLPLCPGLQQNWCLSGPH